MKINRNKRITTKLIIIVIAMILLASIATYAVFTYVNNHNNSRNNGNGQQKRSLEGVDYGSPTKEQQAAGAEQKNQAQTQSQADKSPTTGSNGEVTVTIPSINTSNNQVRISTLIEAVTNTGTCTLILSKDGVVVTKQSNIQAGPSSSTCEGFTISTSELSSGGWQATVKVQIGDKTGSVTQAFQVD